MSDDAVALIERLFGEAAAVSRGDIFDAKDTNALNVIYNALDPTVEFHEDPSFPEAGVYSGIEDVRAYFDRFSDSFDEITFRVEDVIGLGNERALGLYELTTRGQGSGAQITSHPGWLFEFRDGRAIRIDAWLDRETALRNAGVEPDA